MATAYPEFVRRLQNLLEDYRSKKVSPSDLQSAIWQTAEAVVSLEDRELRKCLEWAGGKLELLRFITESCDLLAATIEIVNVVEEKIQEALSG